LSTWVGPHGTAQKPGTNYLYCRTHGRGAIARMRFVTCLRPFFALLISCVRGSAIFCRTAVPSMLWISTEGGPSLMVSSVQMGPRARTVLESLHRNPAESSTGAAARFQIPDNMPSHSYRPSWIQNMSVTVACRYVPSLAHLWYKLSSNPDHASYILSDHKRIGATHSHIFDWT
jgi:hypothetical protein